MRKSMILITGASGEIGHALIENFVEHGTRNILSLDIRPLDNSLKKATTHIVGDICDKSFLERLVSEFEIEAIYHLAALLSTRAEFTPEAAHRVNVDGFEPIRVARKTGFVCISKLSGCVWTARLDYKSSISTSS
jgi:threonine 3-dehydrogenase